MTERWYIGDDEIGGDQSFFDDHSVFGFEFAGDN